MPWKPTPVTVPGIPETLMISSEGQVPAGCRASWGNGAVPFSTSLFAFCGLALWSLLLSGFALAGLACVQVLADVLWAWPRLKCRLIVCLPWPA